MGNSIAKQESINRISRLSLFAEQVKKFLIIKCLDNNIPYDKVDIFSNDLLQSMVSNTVDYSMDMLLAMMSDENFLDSLESHYLSNND